MAIRPAQDEEEETSRKITQVDRYPETDLHERSYNNMCSRTYIRRAMHNTVDPSSRDFHFDILRATRNMLQPCFSLLFLCNCLLAFFSVINGRGNAGFSSRPYYYQDQQVSFSPLYRGRNLQGSRWICCLWSFFQMCSKCVFNLNRIRALLCWSQRQ